MSDIIKDTKSRMQKSIDNLSRELANISAGRANSNLLNGVTVDYYGAVSYTHLTLPTKA